MLQLNWTLHGDKEKIFKEIMEATGLSQELLLDIFLRVGVAYFELHSQGRELVIKDKATGKEIGYIKPPRGKSTRVIKARSTPKQ